MAEPVQIFVGGKHFPSLERHTGSGYRRVCVEKIGRRWVHLSMPSKPGRKFRVARKEWDAEKET